MRKNKLKELYKAGKPIINTWLSVPSSFSKELLAGIHNGTPEYAKKMINKDFNMVTVGSDSRYIAAGAKLDLQKLKNTNKEPDTKGY